MANGTIIIRREDGKKPSIHVFRDSNPKTEVPADVKAALDSIKGMTLTTKSVKGAK